MSFSYSPLNRYTVLLLTLLCSNKWWIEREMLYNGLFSLLCKLFPFQCIVAQMKVKCPLFYRSKEKLSMHAKQASPSCHRRTCDKYLLSSSKWKQRHRLEQPLWPCVFLNLAKIQLTQLSKFKVLKNENGNYAWLFACFWELTMGVFVLHAP